VFASGGNRPKQQTNKNTTQMNPHQMAKAQCDCYQPDGTCLGITCDDKLKPVRFRPEGSKCLLVEPVKRCQHFESSILPYNPEDKDSRLDAKKKSEWAEGSHAYRIATGYMAETVRLCPQCRTSKIGIGRKVCDLCKAKNRRESQSKYHQSQNTESHSDSSSISGVDNQ
jgi:hypothetical protein